MRIRFDPTALRQTRWHGHLIRFVLGGVVTVATGLVAKGMGPSIGGLFLAFPAIFPIGLAMIEKLQNEQVGATAKGHRARRAGIAEAAGASAGSVGLVGFAAATWIAARTGRTLVALGWGMLAWSIVAFGTWTVRRVLVDRRR
jgi:hypothetical protein